MLTRQYAGRDDLLAHLPGLTQIKYRKAYLMSKLAKQTKVHCFSDWSEWAGIRECKTTTVFFGAYCFDRETDETAFSAKPFAFQNATLVLHCFRHSYEDEMTKESYGLVLTTRRIFRNVLYAVQCQSYDGVFASVDSTYKHHYGGWVLVAFGTYKSYFSPWKKYYKSVVPWA
ncbi:hypothetical protein PR003_g4608 [Phytophthora rubi]|uniref:Uncharacterized protein n=1 Tax=Phytophthora rubi TaxID=129364 RepID=A0A6A3NIN8_9STRA|nr:hypothetical protein PR002_g4626 [Phytophthora rubi]KAE9046784.1 hypothetical protein PR001_g4420 [Phytophthora rubi]KAE9352019.1 hypothetical protein PR003_g4608 [Phytophthora rubi]